MIGVEILSTFEVARAWAFNWWVFGIFAALSLILSICLAITTYQETNSGTFAVGISCIILSFALGLSVTFGSITALPVEYETQYKVVISDEVSLNDFYEKYETLSQEGKILTVREKGGQ